MAAGQRTFDDLLSAIREGQEAGVLTGEDPRSIAGPTWALLHGVASLHVGGDLSHVAILEPVDELAARSVAALLASAMSG
jgi:Tetracyclin repressor-like, C-terminal domain